MMAKKTNEQMNDMEILKVIDEKQKEILLARFQLLSNSLKDLCLIKNNRKEIAQLKRQLKLIAKGDNNGKK